MNTYVAVHDGLPAPQRYWAAMAVAMGISLSVMDSSIVNVALPTLAKELGVSEAASVWIFNAYSLSVLAFLLPCAALGERFGLQRVFRFGLGIFVLGSCGFMVGNTLLEICLFKIVQGVGGAAMMSMMGGLTRFNYPAALFGRGIGINAMVVAVSSMIGPVVGSIILHYANWHWLTSLHIPLGLTALMMSRYLAHTPQRKQHFDLISAVLSALTLCLLVYALDSIIVEFGRAIICMLIALFCGWQVVRRAKKQTMPLVPLDLLSIKEFRFAVYASACSFAAAMAGSIALPFHLYNVFGFTQLEIGYILVVWPIGSGTMAMLAARLSEKYSVSVLAGIGTCLMAGAMFTLAVLPADIDKLLLAIPVTLIGVGFGFFQMPNNKAMLSAAPKERSGAAGGAQATTRVFSQSVGAAIVALTFALPVEDPTRYALVIGAICGAMAAVVNVRRFRTTDKT